MYVCGPTVYQRIHVGNARPYVVFLWLKRWLEQAGYDVTLVENVTDVNDKIYEAAGKQGIASAELAAAATQWYFEDTDALGLGRPDHEPLASETIPEIVGLIEELVGAGSRTSRRATCTSGSRAIPTTVSSRARSSRTWSPRSPAT